MGTRFLPAVADPAEAEAIAAAIAVPAHVVQAKGHGHAGTAMALAPLAHVLFQRVLRHNPADPEWVARDRIVLSAGHASLLLYMQLYLTGYGLELGEIAASRTLGARTPGHPELSVTPGVSMSTGPLGQGVASAVGMAMAARHEAAVFTAGSDLLDHTIWALAGDGCLQEGVSGEASSLAGTVGLENLVVIWDDNRVTIDGGTEESMTEDVRARYRSYGWRVLDLENLHDLDHIERVLRQAAEPTGAPTLVAVRSVIGWPAESVAGTPAAHAGGIGADELAAVKVQLGFDPDTDLDGLVTERALAFTRRARSRGESAQARWTDHYRKWADHDPEAAAAWAMFRQPSVDTLVRADHVDPPPPGTLVATRKASGAVIKALHNQPVRQRRLWGGSADLAASTNVAVDGQRFSAADPAGEFIRFGIREHAMAAILNGIALHGPWRPYGSTYLAFSDYMRPAVRLAALMELPVVYVFTHDSVAVGEDGPTHQPVEQIAGLRTVPGLDVVRPADAVEVKAAWRRILAQPDRPTALVLSRQDVPVLPQRSDVEDGVARGAYVAWCEGDGLDLAIIATGSEVQLAVAAAQLLAAEQVAARVVSMPCVEWFLDADHEYVESVLPKAVTARVAVEAGRGDAWYRWTGSAGQVVSVESFGESGSGAEVMRRCGVHLDAVVAAARATLNGC
ncbi:transketolase [Phytoactinopolyspora limicola]|uniref:transketolase n=1 Tax=Phytoactinopolyspora limicola TaxID=2715536 RepID=UPI001407E16A|nr:transketolase [Phytoactinopolyspora limicola]